MKTMHADKSTDVSTLPIGETALFLGVSSATVRNWTRAGYLTPVSSRPLTFIRNDVNELKERILNNRFNKLRKRANRTASEKHHRPDIISAKITSDLSWFIKILRKNNLDASRAIYTAAVHYLASKGEAELRYENGVLHFDNIVWRRRAVAEIMRAWLERNGGIIHPPAPGAIEAFLAWEDCDDHLGILYQGLCSIGRKALTGAYFTPKNIIEQCLEGLDAEQGAPPGSFLDPSCGTGRYLRCAAERFGIPPESLHGFDADPVAVDIAKINLLMQYGDRDFMPNIHCLDSLNDLANGEEGCPTNHLLGAVDAIATNPPWGGCKNHARCKNLVSVIQSGESFSLFLGKALTLLRPGGRLSFLLPEAALRIKAHTDIRRLLLDETTIVRISLLGRVFPNVFTDVIRLNLVKAPAPDGWMTAVETGAAAVHTVPQKRFAANRNLAFDVSVTPDDEELLRKIYSIPHQTLRGNAEWALGIVTGDNAHCVFDRPGAGTEPVLRGRDVFRFAARAPRRHIAYAPECKHCGIHRHKMPELYAEIGREACLFIHTARNCKAEHIFLSVGDHGIAHTVCAQTNCVRPVLTRVIVAHVTAQKARIGGVYPQYIIGGQCHRPAQPVLQRLIAKPRYRERRMSALEARIVAQYVVYIVEGALHGMGFEPFRRRRYEHLPHPPRAQRHGQRERHRLPSAERFALEAAHGKYHRAGDGEYPHRVYNLIAAQAPFHKEHHNAKNGGGQRAAQTKYEYCR